MHKRRVKRSSKSWTRIVKSNSSRKPSEESVSEDASSQANLSVPITDTLKKLNFKYEAVLDSAFQQNSLFFQDMFMNNFFSNYPQYVCFDVLCEIPDLDQCLALFIGLDSNGHCEIISLGLIKSENQQGFSWLCEAFKKNNLKWKNIEFILSDQSCDREILLKAFPEKLIFVSFFHSMKAFKKDISSLNPAIGSSEIDETLQLFEQMMFVTSESEYMEIMRLMKQVHPQIFSLFKKKWHLKRELWSMGFYSDSKMLLKAFNSYLLSIRRKIKPIVSTQVTFENVIKNIHSAIIKLRKEWFQKFTCMFQSPAMLMTKVHALQKYSKVLTPFATELINEQLNNSENMKNIQKIDRKTYRVNGTVASFLTCSCSFHTLMMLPCCHIFAVRNFLSLPLFVGTLRLSWGALEYYEKFFDLHTIFTKDEPNAEVSKRYKESVQTNYELWNLILNCPENVSQERLEIFQNLLKCWKNNFKVGITVSEKPNDFVANYSEGLENLSTNSFKEIYGISVSDILNSENDFSDVSLCSADENDIL